ncbi:MAG: hypothetical protein QXP81_01505 [Nitrososphaerota archaeon]
MLDVILYVTGLALLMVSPRLAAFVWAASFFVGGWFLEGGDSWAAFALLALAALSWYSTARTTSVKDLVRMREAARRARRLREELKIMKRNEAAAIAVYSLCREMGVHIPPSVLFRRFRVRPSRMMKSLALLRSPRPDPEEVLESVLDRLQVSGPERGAILRAFRSLTFRNPWVRAAAAVIAVRPDLRRRVAEVTGILSALRRDWPHRLNEPRGRGPSR